MQHHPLHSGVGGSKQPKDNNNHDEFILKALQSAQALRGVQKMYIKRKPSDSAKGNAACVMKAIIEQEVRSVP